MEEKEAKKKKCIEKEKILLAIKIGIKISQLDRDKEFDDRDGNYTNFKEALKLLDTEGICTGSECMQWKSSRNEKGISIEGDCGLKKYLNI